MGFKQLFSVAALAVVTLLMSGCGGSGTSTSTEEPVSSATTVSGTAAGGAPIVGIVYLKDALDVEIQSDIATDGSYTLDVTDLTAPFKLRAVGYVGSREVSYVSYAEEADMNGTVNITQFTDLIIANAAGQLSNTFFEGNTALDSAELVTQKTALKEKLIEVFNSLGLDASLDLLNTSFSADHTGLDAALDLISIETNTTTNIATITNLVDNTTISDDINDTTDNNTTLTVTTDLAAYTNDAQGIYALFDAFSSEFATSVPSAAALKTYFDPAFLHQDISSDLLIANELSNPAYIGSNMVVDEIDDLNTTMGTATVKFTIFNSYGFVADVVTWGVKYDGTQWLMYGDQKVFNDYINYGCSEFKFGGVNLDGTVTFDTTMTGTGCGFWMDFNDFDITNNGTGVGPIHTARTTIVDENGTQIIVQNMDLSDAFTPGTLYDVNDGDDYIQYEVNGVIETGFTGIDSIDPGSSKFKVELFDTSDFTGGADITYYKEIPTTIPTISSSGNKLPSITSVSNALDGTVTAQWTNPSDTTGIHPQSLFMSVCDDSYSCAEDGLTIGLTDTSGSVSVDPTQWSAGTTVHVMLIVEYVDNYGNNFNSYAFYDLYL